MPPDRRASRLLQLLLRAELVGVAALLLTAVGGTRRKTGLVSSAPVRLTKTQDYGCSYVALPANHLVAVVLGGKSLQGRLNDTTTETEHQVEGRLL